MDDKLNIWKGMNFEDSSSKTVYDYLISQNHFLEKATNSELKMEIESVDSYLDEKGQYIPVGLSMLFVVAPKLGNFRRKILTVLQGRYGGRFPVDIYSHIGEKKVESVEEDSFLRTVEEILNTAPVQSSILTLYQQSKEVQ